MPPNGSASWLNPGSSRTETRPSISRVSVLVAAKFVASKTGIGYLIWNSWELLQVDIMFVGIVTVGILGLITSVLFPKIERKVICRKAG
jgi:NitT/TauT family transport system permease protein